MAGCYDRHDLIIHCFLLVSFEFSAWERDMVVVFDPGLVVCRFGCGRRAMRRRVNNSSREGKQ